MRYFICHDPTTCSTDLQDVRPRYMTSVPRIFDRVLAGVQGKAMKARRLTSQARPVGLARRPRVHGNVQCPQKPVPMLALRYTLAKRLVFDKVRAALGLDRVEYLTSGSAALHPDIAMTFLAIGVPIMQGYGLTETSPVITVSRPSDNKYGAVGKPIPAAT